MMIRDTPELQNAFPTENGIFRNLKQKSIWNRNFWKLGIFHESRL